MKIKYVVFNELNAVLLPCSMTHSDMRCAEEHNGKITSAGFCSFVWSPEECGFKVDVFGESISLKLKPGKNDAWCIEFLLNRG